MSGDEIAALFWVLDTHPHKDDGATKLVLAWAMRNCPHERDHSRYCRNCGKDLRL